MMAMLGVPLTLGMDAYTDSGAIGYPCCATAGRGMADWPASRRPSLNISKLRANVRTAGEGTAR